MRSRIRMVVTGLILAVIAAACSQITPEELAARYEQEPNGPDAGGVSQLPDPADVTPTTTTEPSDGDQLADGEPLSTQKTTCPFDVDSVPVKVDCGTMRIPSPDSATTTPIDIAYAVFQSLAATPDPDPVIYLHGGPGGDVLAAADWIYLPVVEPFIGERDVILFDQREAGESSALPICHEAYILDDDFFASGRLHGDIAADYDELVASCGRRMSRNDQIDLSQYNSATHADDVIRLTRALGIEEYNLYGNSYGTRLAQTIMRDHPEQVRSVILSGVYPVEENLIGSVPASFEAALDRVFTACTESEICSEALPDPWAAFERVVAALDADPVPVQVPLTEDQSFDALINGDDLVNGFHALLYTAPAAAMIPDTLIDFLDGDVSRVQRIGRDGIYDTGDIAAYVAVQCREEAPFITADQRDLADDRDTPYERINLAPGLVGIDLIRACESWNTGVADPLENQPVVWDVPTLILSGGIDPITPPWWAEAVAERLPNATLISSPELGHDSDEGQCSPDIMAAFVRHPDEEVRNDCEGLVTAPFIDDQPVRLVPELAPDLLSTTFDAELGSGRTVVDIQVPDWVSNAIPDEEAWWRGLDWLDSTVVVARAGPIDRDELYWYLDVEVDGAPKRTGLPDGFPPGWRRLELETGGLDLIVYERTEGFEMNVALIGYDDEMTRLEINVLIPMVRSISLREES